MFRATSGHSPASAARTEATDVLSYTEPWLRASENPALLPLGSDAVPEIPGWATAPPQLLKKISSLEYVDMRELFPESWHLEQQSEGCCR